MLLAAFGSVRVGFAAGIAGFAGGVGEVYGEMAESGQSCTGEIAEALEAAVGAIVDEEALGGEDIG